MKKRMQNKYVLLGSVVLLYSLLMIPIIVINNNQKTTVSTHAQTIIQPTPIPKACTTDTPTNILLLIDRASTMEQSDQTNINHLSAAELAAMNFVASVSADSRNTIGLVSYSSNATVDSHLTNNFPTVQNHIASLTASGYTCISCALQAANAEFAKDQNPDNKNAIILLTDGTADATTETSGLASESNAEQDALAQTNQSKSLNIAIYPVGIGGNIDNQFLQNLAATTSGQYFWSPSTQQLGPILNILSDLILKGESCIPIAND
jgi:Mg-chelatase subunit ChlD